MDGIGFQRALVVGDSGGIGSAISAALKEKIGKDRVTGLSRRRDGIDLLDEQSIVRTVNTLDGPYDLILVTTGALRIGDHRPEKALSDIKQDALAAQFALNATGPILVLKHVVDLMPLQRKAVFAALSARVGSIGDNRLGGWYAYRAAKAALNQLLHSAAIEIARKRRQAICVALHPGTVRTPFTAPYQDRHAAVAPEEAAENLLSVIDGLTVVDSGGFFDWAGHRVAW